MILKAQQITKRFASPEPLELLKGIDLQVERGSTVAIMGRSGEGKSTLLHILGTLDAPSSGDLVIASQPVSRTNKAMLRNRHIGFIFQSYHLLEEYTVLQNVLIPRSIARDNISKGSEACLFAEKLLEQVGLHSRMHHFGKQLSGGEKQRAAIARALCNDPDLLLADEPSGNLDRKTAEGIHQLLLNFANSKGKSLIVVTHDTDLAGLCSCLYKLQNGTLERIR